MNMCGLFIGAFATDFLGSLAAEGKMGLGFAMMAAALVLAVLLQLTVLRPVTLNAVDDAPRKSSRAKSGAQGQVKYT